MAPFPTPGEYQEAVQFPTTAFLDPELREAEPVSGPLGLPKVITGAFAAVFPMEGRTRRWAVKCFLTDVPDQRKRYAAIARHLEHSKLSFIVPFDYQRRGIRVGDQVFPVLKMEWVDGTPLNEYVRRHRQEADVLEELCTAWVGMLEALEEAGVAHGDLQHGNVLVIEEDGRPDLRLVDYDTMYVPALRGRQSPEVGHRNYQHPDRDERDFGPYLDRFAGLVIYTALRACRYRPDLMERYDTGENLLFQAADFYDPSGSPLFQELDDIEPLQTIVETLRTACYLEPETVPSLTHARELAGGHRVRVGLARFRRSLEEAVEKRRRSGKTTRRPFERLFLPSLVASLAVGTILIAVGVVIGGWVTLAAGTGALTWLAWIHHRRLTPVRRRRRLRRELVYFDRLLKDLSRQIERLQQQRNAILDNVEAMREERLREVQEEALENCLKHHFTDEAGRFEGISHKVVVRLKGAGIRNAYQATPNRLAKIKSIGDESKARVALWRAALVAQYADEVPEVLSPAEERRFERFVEQRLGSIDAEVARLQEKRNVQHREQERVEDRLEHVPNVTFGRYLRFLCYLEPLLETSSSIGSPPVRHDPQKRNASEHVASEPDEPVEAAWWKGRS